MFNHKSIKIASNIKVATICAILSLGGGISNSYTYASTHSSVISQVSSATGVVVDDAGVPIIGANVIIKGTKEGTQTDVNGKFTLANVKQGAVLEVSYIGFISQDIIWKGEPLTVELKEDKKLLDEVVVVAFGTQKKVNLTGAVSTVDSKQISARPINNVSDALQGTVPGLTFNTPSSGGTLNSTKGIEIRGKGTIGAGSSVSPLVLIDGMQGDMNSLNPQDIESISVLKDASASSIYGSRAAGGVILITTKSGKEGTIKINYNNSFRYNSPINLPHQMNSYDWAVYMNDANINSGDGVWFSTDKLNAIKQAQCNPDMPKMFANKDGRWEVWDNNALLPIGNTDWLHEHFKNSFSQEHTFSVSGGGKNVRYYFSANYLNQNGILRYAKDDKQRYNITSKVNIDLASWITMTYTTRLSRIDFQAPREMASGNNEFYHNMMRYWPIIPVKDPNGNYVKESYIERLKHGGIYKTQNDVVAQQVAFRLNPLNGLVVNAELNYRVNTNFNHTDNQTTYAYNVNNQPYKASGLTTSVKESGDKSNYFNSNIYAEYSVVLGRNNFKIMGGFQSEVLNSRDVWASKDGIMSRLATLNTTTTNPDNGGGYASWSTAGFFGRFNYDFDGRYLLEVNMRYDGSSRFLKANRWNFSPSFSAGWNIAKEPFWKKLHKYVNTLKLRGSWGELGNQNTDNWYPFYPSIGFSAQGGNWLLDGKKPNVAWMPGLVSASLTWEKTRTWELGLDWGAFNDRLTGSFGYYRRKTYDMVGPGQELPDILGAQSPKTNNLDMTSKGWDLQIGWKDVVKDFSYGVALTLSDNIVVIDKYPNPSKSLGQYYNGRLLGEIWGFQTIGIAANQAEMNEHIKVANQNALGSKWTAGDIMYADLNGDGKVDRGQNTLEDHGDLKIIGNSTPRYNFGLNLDAAWKGFDFKLFFQGTLKRDYFPNGAPFWGATGQGKWQAVGLTIHSNHWTPKNLNAYYPRADFNGGRNTHTQTRYLQNAAYCRLKNLTIGYTLPTNITNKVNIQNLRFFVSGENLLTFTKFTKVSDPELIGAGYGGNIGKTYPLSKTWSLGLSITF